MGKLYPARPPEAVRLKFTFRMSPEWIDRHIVEHGTRPPEIYNLDLDLTELDDPALRGRFVSVHEKLSGLGLSPPLNDVTDDFTKLIEILESAAIVANRPANEFVTQMREWIEEHGSERLKRAQARNYKVTATYARERAALEYPEFWVDTKKSSKWYERTDPTLEALDLENEVRDLIAKNGDQGSLGARIVWLTAPPDDLERALSTQPRSFKSCEAIVVGAYLGRYWLIRPLPFPRSA
jgi:hypothetical protein